MYKLVEYPSTSRKITFPVAVLGHCHAARILSIHFSNFWLGSAAAKGQHGRLESRLARDGERLKLGFLKS
jgi:hypothetical protein